MNEQMKNGSAKVTELATRGELGVSDTDLLAPNALVFLTHHIHLFFFIYINMTDLNFHFVG